MSLDTVAFNGIAPIGSLLAGAAADRLGANFTIAIGGAVSIAAGAFFVTRLPLIRHHVRPIYERLGIIPELARGIQAATAEPVARPADAE
jgi:hypothetical protein